MAATHKTALRGDLPPVTTSAVAPPKTACVKERGKPKEGRYRSSMRKIITILNVMIKTETKWNENMA